MSVTEPVKVLIGIVTYNHRRFIADCLDSVPASAKRYAIKTVVVDSNSSDGSADLVRDQYPGVELIQRDRLYSFSNNNNVAYASSPSEYFLLLNPDTELSEGAVDRLVDFMEQHPSCGICGPKLVFPDGSLQYSCRQFPTFWSTLVRRTPLRSLFPKERRGVKHLMVSISHQDPMPVDWMLGAALLVRRDAIADVDLLDEGFPLYCEEIDLCLRLKQGDWETYYVPSVTVVHHHLAESDSKLFSRASMLHARSMVHFIKKHYFRWGRPSGSLDGVAKRKAVGSH